MKTLEKTIVGDTTPINKNVLWVDSKNNLIKYNNNNKWVRISNPNNLSPEIVPQLNSLGYTYIGTATPSTTPVTLAGDEKVFYIATEEGDYSSFGVGNITELSIIKSENGNWKAEGLGVPFKKYVAKEEIYAESGIVIVEDQSLNLKDDVNILTMNVFNKNSIQSGLLNDTGEFISHPSDRYANFFIPAKGGLTLTANFQISKFYYYDLNKNLIKRTLVPSNNVAQVLSKTYDLQNVEREVGYIQIQFTQSDLDTIGVDNAMAVIALGSSSQTPTIPSEYIAFEYKKGGNVNGKSYIYTDDFGEIYKLTKVHEDGMVNELDERIEELEKSIYSESVVLEIPFSNTDVWEPNAEDIDEGYSTPVNSPKRAEWTAADKYTYYDFLAHYYDLYLGYHEEGNYRVTKKGLWNNYKTGHEVFEYDFCPKDYEFTVMLSAGMNADELQGIWALATFIRCVMEKKEPMLTIMKQKVRFKVIPILNAYGFDQDTFSYYYLNYEQAVNPNFNFNYKNSWNTQTNGLKGDYADSCNETVGLKNWINENKGKANLWIDLHTGNFSETTKEIIVDFRLASSSDFYGDFNNVDLEKIYQFYKNKGTSQAANRYYIGAAKDISSNVDYAKHAYATQVCDIISAMSEMHLNATGYGSDGLTNNDVAGIQCYVLQLRQFIIYCLNRAKRDYTLPNNITARRYSV